MPARVLPFDPADDFESGPTQLPATEPSAALHAVLYCFSLHQRKAWGRPLSPAESETLARLQAQLHSDDEYNRRRWNRMPESRRIWIDVVGPARMVELSGGGLRVGEASRTPEVGARVEVCTRIRSTAGVRTLILPSRVVWNEPVQGSFGLAFCAPARWG